MLGNQVEDKEILKFIIEKCDFDSELSKALEDFFPKPPAPEPEEGEEEAEEAGETYVDIAALAKKDFNANAHAKWKTEGKTYEKKLEKLETKVEKAEEVLATA